MYSKMYYRLFNAVSDALQQMEQQNYGAARQILVAAQQDCEAFYLDAAEDET